MVNLLKLKKLFTFNDRDSIGDGGLTVQGTAMIGSYALGAATVWQDLDNDGVKDAERQAQQLTRKVDLI